MTIVEPKLGHCAECICPGCKYFETEECCGGDFGYFECKKCQPGKYIAGCYWYRSFCFYSSGQADLS